jgi:hypothetical protein
MYMHVCRGCVLLLLLLLLLLMMMVMVGELAVKYRLSADTVSSVLAHFSMAK